MRKTIFVIFVILLLLRNAIAFADIPHLINYQGRLTDSQGTPITGTKAVTFRIYDTESGGSALWSETYSNLAFDRGIFNVMLGGVTALNLAFDKPYWLSIQVGGDPEMSPRLVLASSGYAFNADRLDGKPVTEFSLAGHTHDASNITSGILPIARGGTGVANKTVTIIQYAGNSVNNRAIPHGLGTTPGCVEICATNNYGAVSAIWLTGMDANSCKDLAYSQKLTNAIIGVDATNVILGPHGSVNQSGITYTMKCTAGQ
jgi:hypothetical protein